MPCRKQVHSSMKSAAEYWVPAFAGMTELRMRVLFRAVVYRETCDGRPPRRRHLMRGLATTMVQKVLNCVSGL
jgi:hypothetical protein